MNQDTRSTSVIVAECGTLAQDIHDRQQKLAQGDGSVEPELTNEMYQLAHDEGILSVRHAKGDTAAVFKNPFARV